MIGSRGTNYELYLAWNEENVFLFFLALPINLQARTSLESEFDACKCIWILMLNRIKY